MDRSLVGEHQLEVSCSTPSKIAGVSDADEMRKFRVNKNHLNSFTRTGLAGLRLSLVSLATSFCFITDAFALGVGAAEADSYIGQPLRVRIPLFNVKAPQSLEVELESDRNSLRGQAPLSATIDRSNSQLGVLISSSAVVAEPYISFKLNLEDQNSVFTKEFRVLLNLAPNSNNRSSSAAASQIAVSDTFSVADITRTSGVMGPYEWAEAGSIPQRFGAVLDGQSLWRVARRINKAMGVSQNQMMWSLFQANPSAFSDNTIESLKAGTYLTIPSYAEVTKVSDGAAKQNLDRLSGAVAIVRSDVLVTPGEDTFDGLVETQAEPEQSFQLTGVGEEAVSGSVGGGAQSNEIISSLAETVNNLSEQIVLKDQKIESLQAQVDELKAFISEPNEPSVVGAIVDSDAADVAEKPLATVDQSPVSTQTVSEPVVVDTQAKIDGSVLESVTTAPVMSEEGSEKTSAKEMIAKAQWWHWALIGFAGLIGLSLLLKGRLSKLLQSLNLFGSKEDVAFDAPAAQPLEENTVLNIEELLPSRSVVLNQDYTSLTARDKSSDDDSGVEGISFEEIEHEEEFESDLEVDDTLEFVSVDDSDIGDDGDMTFDERFDRLLEDKDYDFARELLDFARYNEIDDERYHCERLRLLKAMRDEDGFYEYYYEIESKIPNFPPALQTEISQFVVQLAQA